MGADHQGLAMLELASAYHATIVQGGVSIPDYEYSLSVLLFGRTSRRLRQRPH